MLSGNNFSSIMHNGRRCRCYICFLFLALSQTLINFNYLYLILTRVFNFVIAKGNIYKPSFLKNAKVTEECDFVHSLSSSQSYRFRESPAFREGGGGQV